MKMNNRLFNIQLFLLPPPYKFSFNAYHIYPCFYSNSHMYSMCRGGFTCLNPVIMSSFSPPHPSGEVKGGPKGQLARVLSLSPPPPNLNDHQTAGYKGWAGFKLEHSLFILVGGLSLCICFYPCRSVRPYYTTVHCHFYC